MNPPNHLPFGLKQAWLKRKQIKDERDQNIANYFWKYVDIKQPDQCWPWTRCSFQNRYGAFVVRGKTCRAHRIAYELTNGPIPKTLIICHRCDNPPCCNPGHLFIGTTKDNARDRSSKARHADVRGAKNPAAKLNRRKVENIRKRYAEKGITMRSLGEVYGVTPSAINMIIKRHVWKHI